MRPTDGVDYGLQHSPMILNLYKLTIPFWAAIEKEAEQRAMEGNDSGEAGLG